MSKKETRTKHRNHKKHNLFMLTIALTVITLLFHPAEAKKIPSTNALPRLASNEIRVHFIDLGQADGILLQSTKNAVLIDGGERKTQNTLINYLQNTGITVLDYIVATHPHSDHIGGLAAVIQQFDVKNILMPDITHNTATFHNFLNAIENKNIPATMPSVGDKITAGIIELTVLAPFTNFDNLNNASIILRMAHGKTSFLFTGDAEIQSEIEMINSGLNLRANILKAGHHGSRTSTSIEFLDAVKPQIVIVTCGHKNSYGHPHKEFLERISQPKRKITLFRTDEMGTIIITANKRKMKIYFVEREKK